jgi:uncharacterized protein
VSDRALLSTQIDLRPLAEAELPLDRVFTPEQLGTAGEDFALRGPARFTGTLSRRGERFQLTGRVQASLELPCGRCLEPFVCPVDTAVDLSYVPDRSATAGQEDEVELQDEDLTTAYYHDHVLELGEMVREQFYLALPMQPLCREDCRGLCPQCGTNRNTDPCDCRTAWDDPRLAALRALITPKTD